MAQQILWNCLIEDPALVLRHFLEKLTVSNRQVGDCQEEMIGKKNAVGGFSRLAVWRQDDLMYMLRKLLLNIGDLPAQTSHILFNYLVRIILLARCHLAVSQVL